MRAGCLIAALAGQPMAVASTFGQSRADTLPLAAAIVMAREANPRLQAARLEADAAQSRPSRVGALPDPTFGFALKNRPLDGFGTDERMTMNSFQLAQRFPWPGKLGFSEEAEGRLANAARYDAEEAEAALIGRVRERYHHLAYLDRAVLIMGRTRTLLGEFLDVSTTLYSVGAGLQQDVLQAQIAVASMDEDITVMEEDRNAMAARLNALLGRVATAPIGALELPPPGDPLPEVDELMEMARANRPALLAARERIAASEAAYRAARRSVYPDFMVMVEYGQRPQFADMLTVGVGITVPVWAGSKQLPARDETRALESARRSVELDQTNETYARLAEARAQAQRARRLERLYAASILPQARAAVESSLSAYRVGKVDYMTLVQNELTVNRYEIESVKLTTTYHQAVAAIEALLGTPLEEDR